MKERIYNTRSIALATAITIGGSALVASCAAPDGTHSVGRVISHEVTTRSGTKLQQFPHNSAKLPLVDSKEVDRYLITIRNCGTMTPPPDVKQPECQDKVYDDISMYELYADGTLVEFNRERVIGEFVLPEISNS